MMERKIIKKLIFKFKAIFSFLSKVIFQIMLMSKVNSSYASDDGSLNGAKNFLVNSGFKNVELCYTGQNFHECMDVPVIYKAVLEENYKKDDVYVFVTTKRSKTSQTAVTIRTPNNDNHKLTMNYKNGYTLNLKPLIHKSIIPILKTLESTNFYYCVQRIATKEEKCIDQKELNGISLWQAKKLILSYCYGLYKLNENGIIREYDLNMEIPIDKNFNVKLYQFLNVKRCSNYGKETNNSIIYRQNICEDLYDFTDAPMEPEYIIRNASCSNDLYYLKRDYREILLKTTDALKYKGTNILGIFPLYTRFTEFRFLRQFEFYRSLINENICDAFNFYKFVFNHEFMQSNIIKVFNYLTYLRDTDEVQDYRYEIYSSKLTVFSRKSPSFKYEFERLNHKNQISLNDSYIHYRDMTVRKNGVLINFDELSEEEFLAYKKEIDALSSAIYSCTRRTHSTISFENVSPILSTIHTLLTLPNWILPRS